MSIDAASAASLETARASTPRTGSGILFVLSGPSGVGKDAAIRALKERPGFAMHHVVTATTRRIRAGELHNVDYLFISPEEFLRMQRGGELLEWALVHDNYYGTPLAQVREQLDGGTDVLLKIDVQGARKVKERAPEAVFIFLAPPSIDVLIDRLRQRKTETAHELDVRSANAYREMEAVEQYDYCVINHEDRLHDAVGKVGAIIEAERCRVNRRMVTL